VTAYAEPTWTTPVEAAGAVSVFEDTPVLPSDIVSLLLRFIQTHFMSADRIRNPNLKGQLWTSSTTTTNIVIGPGTSISDLEAGRKPQIRIVRNPMKVIAVGLDPHVLMVEVLASGEESSAVATYTRLMEGGLTVAAVCEKAQDAEFLGEELAFALTPFVQAMREDADIRDFDMGEVATVSPLDKGGFAATLMLNFAVDWKFRIPEEEIW
jgi:hypothetical protein